MLAGAEMVEKGVRSNLWWKGVCKSKGKGVQDGSKTSHVVLI